MLDVVVDLRVGSPTFGQWASVLLDDVDRRAIYIAEGLGHGFCALSDDATLDLHVLGDLQPGPASTPCSRSTPTSAITWPVEQPLLSERDAAAPTLAQALEQGLLPDYATCR